MGSEVGQGIPRKARLTAKYAAQRIATRREDNGIELLKDECFEV